jgi:hypothetical protein
MYTTALKHKWDAQDKLESAWEGGGNEGRLEGQLEGQRTEK